MHEALNLLFTYGYCQPASVLFLEASNEYGFAASVTPLSSPSHKNLNVGVVSVVRVLAASVTN